LLRLKRQQPIIKTRWIILPFIIFGLMYAWQQQFWTAWVIIPMLWCVLVINISLLTRSQRARLQKIEQLKIEPIFWNKLRQFHPELTLKQRQLIEAGFKDYLALHVLQKQAYAMPSNAVVSKSAQDETGEVYSKKSALFLVVQSSVIERVEIG